MEQLAGERRIVMDPMGLSSHSNPGNGQVSKALGMVGMLNLEGAEIHSHCVMRELIELARQGMKVNLNGASIDCEDDED